MDGFYTAVAIIPLLLSNISLLEVAMSLWQTLLWNSCSCYAAGLDSAIATILVQERLLCNVRDFCSFIGTALR